MQAIVAQKAVPPTAIQRAMKIKTFSVTVRDRRWVLGLPAVMPVWAQLAAVPAGLSPAAAVRWATSRPLQALPGVRYASPLRRHPDPAVIQIEAVGETIAVRIDTPIWAELCRAIGDATAAAVAGYADALLYPERAVEFLEVGGPVSAFNAMRVSDAVSVMARFKHQDTRGPRGSTFSGQYATPQVLIPVAGDDLVAIEERLGELAESAPLSAVMLGNEASGHRMYIEEETANTPNLFDRRFSLAFISSGKKTPTLLNVITAETLLAILNRILVAAKAAEDA